MYIVHKSKFKNIRFKRFKLIPYEFMKNPRSPIVTFFKKLDPLRRILAARILRTRISLRIQVAEKQTKSLENNIFVHKILPKS